MRLGVTGKQNFCLLQITRITNYLDRGGETLWLDSKTKNIMRDRDYSLNKAKAAKPEADWSKY